MISSVGGNLNWKDFINKTDIATTGLGKFIKFCLIKMSSSQLWHKEWHSQCKKESFWHDTRDTKHKHKELLQNTFFNHEKCSCND